MKIISLWLTMIMQGYLIIDLRVSRGCFAIGGEWLLIPLWFVIYFLVQIVIDLWEECFNEATKET